MSRVNQSEIIDQYRFQQVAFRCLIEEIRLAYEQELPE
jgi:hypothetical protein